VTYLGISTFTQAQAIVDSAEWAIAIRKIARNNSTEYFHDEPM
jgi:hypothetical protein